MDNKFGLFIHWGIHSLLGVHEQVLARNNMDNAEYEALATRFNPVDYDPDEWVRMAKDAGMKYICFTAKHHDGFCMFNTQYTDYNIMHTPYGKDVLKMLAEACAREGMLLSIYYSNPDWNCPVAHNPNSGHQWKCTHPEIIDLDAYRTFVKNQITELLTNYGPIYTLFWDIGPGIYDPSMNELVRKLQPNILINDRGWSEGDFATPEREVPDGQHFTRMTEACQAVGEQSWGYRSNEDYYSHRFLMKSIAKVMAMGGSYLLNVGPMPDGRIDERSKSILKRIGDWYNRMEGCLENGETEPLQGCGLMLLRDDPVCRIRKGNKTYLCFYDGLAADSVNFMCIPALPKAVRLMNNGQALGTRQDTLPNYFIGNGYAMGPYFSITGIPVDDFPAEPIVIEITW